MKPIFLTLKYIKNLVPYFLIIVIYFIIISLEASKEKTFNNVIENEKMLPKNKNLDDGKQLRIEIPVIPYN